MLYPVLPQAESTLDSTNHCPKDKKIQPCFFFLRFQLIMRNYLNKLTIILQFQKTNNANRFDGKKHVENLYTIFFVRFYFVSVFIVREYNSQDYLEIKILFEPIKVYGSF